MNSKERSVPASILPKETTVSEHQMFIKAEVFIDLDKISDDERIFVRALGLMRVGKDKGSYYEANTPDGRRPVELTTINGSPAAAYYRIDDMTKERTIMVARVPGLRKEAITRGSVAVNKSPYYFPHGKPAGEDLR